MATSPLYKTSDEAGTESRRKGQAISSGKYEPGAFARQAIGTEYVPGQYASQQIGQNYTPGVVADQALAAGLPSPSSRRRGIAPSPSGPSAAPTFDPLKAYEESILKDQPQSELRSSAPEGNFLGDSANDLVIGGLQLYGAGYEIANLVSGGAIDQAIKDRTGKTGTQNLAEGRRMLQADQSPALRAQQKELEDAKGFVDSFATVLTNPRLAGSLTMQMVPQLATIGMAARAVAMKTLAWGAEAGLSAEAATAAASTNAARTVLGLNAAMEGGMAGADTRNHILNMTEAELSKSPQYQALLRSGMDPMLARQKLANDASLISTALAASISAVASKVTGAAKLEAAVLGGVVNKVEREVGKKSGMTIAKELGFAGVKETAEETLQEGGAQFAQNVAKQQKIDEQQALMEGVPEAAGAGGAMGLLAGAGFGGAKVAIEKGAEAIATPPGSSTTGQTYSGPGAGRLTDVEMVSAARSPAFMAYQWSVADDATRIRLQNANPNLNLQALAQDVDLVAQGKRLSDSAPQFGQTFLNQLEEFDLTTAQAAADQTQRIAGAPSMEGVKTDADRAMQEAGEGIVSTPPAPSTDQEADVGGDTGVPQITDMSMEEQINRLRGYKRRAQNLEGLPENYRRQQAELSVQEMVDQGFPETVARGVFGGLLYGPSLETVLSEGGHTASQEPAGEVESIGGTPIATQTTLVQETPQKPVTEVLTEFGDKRMSDGTMTDDQFRDALVNWDNRRQGTDGKSTRSDYEIVPLPAPMQKLADALGIQLKGWAWKGDPYRLVSTRQGISMGKGVIGINFGTTSQGGEFVVFGHELFHELASRDRQAADNLIAAMQDFLDGDITEDLREKLRQVGYKEDILAEEIVADVLGVLFAEQSFWKKMAEVQPTLLEKIIDIIRQMINRMSQFGTREKMVRNAIKDLQRVEDMMVGFLNDAINKQAAGTSVQDNIQLNATQAEALQNVRSLLKEGKRSEAAAAFKAANLWKETGLNFNEIETQEVAPIAEEAEVPMRRPQEEVDAENAYRAMLETVDLLRAGNIPAAAKAFKAGNLSAFGENFNELAAQIASERKKRVSEAQFQSDEQKRLTLKSKRSMFDRQIESITSGVTRRVEEMMQQRKDLAIAGARAFRETQTQERAAALMGEEKQRGLLADDTGGVMTQMAELGMYGGAEAQAEASEKRTKAEAARAESDRLAEENATIHNNRVRALLYNADRGLDQLAKVRQEMAAVGYSSNEIEAAVGKSEADLKSLRDGELRKLAEEQLRDAKNIGQREVVTKTEPEQYPGFNEIQAELDLNDDQRRNALALLDAVERKEMSMDDALKAIKVNKIGQMQLYDAMRQRGVPVPKAWIDISGNIAVNYPLNEWVKGFPNSAMAARDAWFRAVDAVPEGVIDLTEGEMVSYRNWKKQTTELRKRLQERQDPWGGEFNSMENAFPHALPLNYTLNEMRNPDSIPEGDRRQMIKMEFEDPVRAWFKDVQYIEQSRPDLGPQFANFLTKAEQEAYAEFKEREASEARRAVEMKTKSALYSQIDGLRFLSPKVYTDFRTQISQAEENQLPAIMQAAFEANEFAEMAKAGGAEFETIGELMNRRAGEDEGLAQSPDQMSTEEELDDDGNYIGYDDSIRFKRGTNSGVLPALNTIESVTEMFRNWKNVPAHTVVQNPNQLPDDVRARIQSSFAASGFKAATDPKTGHMYLFSDFLDGDTDTQFAVFNEIYGQFGVRGFMGDSFKTFLDNQYRLNRKTIIAADKLIAERRAMGIPTTTAEATYAVLGDTAIHTIHTKFANWLDKNGFPAVADWIRSSTNTEVSSILSGVTESAKSNGISPLGGQPNDSMSFDRKKMPVEGYAYRNGQITAYARVNPITGDWIVFTIKPGADSINSGDYNITTTDDLQIAHDMMKQHGTVRLARARETLRYIGPENIEKIKTWNEDDPSWKKFYRWVRQGAQNRFLPIWEVAHQMMMSGKSNTVIDDLVKYESRTGYYIDNYKRRYMYPIMKTLKRLGERGLSIEDVDLFLMARHAEERNSTISAINPDNRKGSGLTTKDAQKILSSRNNGAWDVAAMNDLEIIGRLMDQMSTDKLNYLLQTGMISKYQYEALKRYKHYVNLSGNTETDLDKFDTTQLGGRAFNVRGTDIIRSTGRGTVAVDVLQNTMNSYLSAIIRGQKNRPLQAILDMFEQNPDKTYVEVNPIETVQRVNIEKFNFDNKILKILGTDKDDVRAGKNFLVGLKERMKRGEIDSDDALAEIVQRIRQAEERRAIQPDEAARALRNLNEQVVMTARLSPDGYVSMVELSGRRDPNEVVVKVGGKNISMVFKNGGLPFFQSITGMDIQRSNAVVEYMAKWAQFFSQMVTTWNPAWIPINMIRDIQTAYSNMAADPEVGAALASKMTKAYGRAYKIATRHLLYDWANVKDGRFRNMVDRMQTKYPMSAEDAKLIEEFFEDGAGTYFLDRGSVEMSLQNMQSAMNANKGGATGMTLAAIKELAASVELVGMAGEIAPRLAAYKVLREAGKSREVAARYAKELTVNFNMKGTSKALRGMYVFFNPAVQGTMRMFKDLKAGNLGRFGTTAGVWMGLGFLSTMVARALSGDDEDHPGVDTIDMVAGYKRNTSLTWLPGVVGGSIPVAYGWNVFSAAGQYMYDVVHGHMPSGEAALKVMSAAFDSFSPIGSGADSKSLMGMGIKTITPSIAVPAAEWLMNENRFGAPIYKAQSPYSDIKEANAYMHFDSVNPISKWAMQSLVEVGTNKNARYTPGLVDVNPAMVDHMIKSYVPGLFAEAYNAAGVSIKAARGEETKDMPVPFLDRFKAKAEAEGFDSSAVRNLKVTIDTMWESWKQPDTTPEEKAKMKRDYPELAKLKALSQANEQAIKSARQSAAKIERDPKVSDEYKVEVRNRVNDLERGYNARLVKKALEAGWRDTILYGDGEPAPPPR